MGFIRVKGCHDSIFTHLLDNHIFYIGNNIAYIRYGKKHLKYARSVPSTVNYNSALVSSFTSIIYSSVNTKNS